MLLATRTMTATATIQGWCLFCWELPIVRLLFNGSNWYAINTYRQLYVNLSHFS